MEPPANPARFSLMFFAGAEVRGWRLVRTVKDGETEDDLFAFITLDHQMRSA